uniref:Uncharacterized protein n=3 Tax=Rhodnius prolixus TaxID=13249 RepID=T1I0G5_RHOPR
MRLISERCNRLIIVVSPSFLDSPANKFFVTFAQAIGIKQGQRKIIPCLYKRLQLPDQLRYYYVLDYTRKSQLWDFWAILHKSVISSATLNLPENNLEPVRIRELPKEDTKLAIECKKPEEWVCPVKSKEHCKQMEDPESLPISENDDCKLNVKTEENAERPKSPSQSLFKK